MNYQLKLHPEVISEIEKSYQWYEMQSSGLGIKFIKSIDKKFEEIRLHPEYYSIKKKHFREAKLIDFPFVVVYKVFKKERVVLITFVFHTKRNPKLKYKR